MNWFSTDLMKYYCVPRFNAVKNTFFLLSDNILGFGFSLFIIFLSISFSILKQIKILGEKRTLSTLILVVWTATYDTSAEMGIPIPSILEAINQSSYLFLPLLEVTYSLCVVELVLNVHSKALRHVQMLFRVYAAVQNCNL